MPELNDSIRGCILGGAVGDALGYAVEFMDWEWIRSRYGDEGIREPRLRDGLAEVSDDTQMTLFTVLGMTAIAGPCLYGSAPETASPETCMHWAYRAWYRTQNDRYDPEATWSDWLSGRGELWKWQAPGNTCLGALGSGRYGRMDAPLNDSKGCGGVMRTAPCAFAPAGFAGADAAPEDTAMLLGAKASAVTHCHPMGYISGGMLSDMIFRLVYGGAADVDSAALASLESAKRIWPGARQMDRLERLITSALELAHGSLPDERAISALDPAWGGKGGGWTGDDALAIAVLCAARYPDDFEACVRAAVNHSGDSDSTGAIAGNLLGAWRGIDAVPERWWSKIDVLESAEEAIRRLQEIARKR